MHISTSEGSFGSWDKLFKYYENIKSYFLFYITAITQGKLAQVLIDVILFLFLCVVLREQSETEGFDGDYAWWSVATFLVDANLPWLVVLVSYRVFSIDVVIIDWDYHRLWSPDQPNWAESDKHRHAWNIAIRRFTGLWLARALQLWLLIGNLSTILQLLPWVTGLAMNYFSSLICLR